MWWEGTLGGRWGGKAMVVKNNDNDDKNKNNNKNNLLKCKVPHKVSRRCVRTVNSHNIYIIIYIETSM